MNNLIEISNVYYNNALELIKDNKVSKAVTLIEKCLKYYAKDVQVLNLMGICQYMLCDFDKAYFYWSKSLSCDTDDNRANYYLEDLNSEEFKSFISKYNLAIDDINNLKYKDAIITLEEINQFDKELVEPYVIRGLCYYELKEYSLAKEYIEHALAMDKDNAKYLLYLNEINSKNIPKLKNNSFKKSNITACILAFLLVVTSTLYYQKHNKYIQISNKSTEYEKKIQEANLALETNKTDNNKLKNQLENEKYKNDTLNRSIRIDNVERNNSKSFNGSEAEIFKDAILNFRNKEYSEAIDSFQYIVNKGIEESTVAEAMYYMAVCFEKKENYEMAEKYYSTYISKFHGENYNDDALYNYGLMLYKQGNRDEAKKVLYKLQQEVPNSIFVNSKVRYILSN